MTGAGYSPARRTKVGKQEWGANGWKTGVLSWQKSTREKRFPHVRFYFSVVNVEGGRVGKSTEGNRENFRKKTKRDKTSSPSERR